MEFATFTTKVKCDKNVPRWGVAKGSLSKGPVGTALVVLVVKTLHPNAGGLGEILGQGTRSHMPELRAGVAKKSTESSCCCCCC